MIEFGCSIKIVNIGAIKAFVAIRFGELKLEGFTVVEDEDGLRVEFTKPRIKFRKADARKELCSEILSAFRKKSEKEGSAPGFNGRCLNCGDKTPMPSTAVAERAKLGWCSGCFNQMKKCKKTRKRRDGAQEEYWTDRSENRNYFTSRPGHPADDSP
jgi:hypothetical protein